MIPTKRQLWTRAAVSTLAALVAVATGTTERRAPVTDLERTTARAVERHAPAIDFDSSGTADFLDLASFLNEMAPAAPADGAVAARDRVAAIAAALGGHPDPADASDGRGSPIPQHAIAAGPGPSAPAPGAPRDTASAMRSPVADSAGAVSGARPPFDAGCSERPAPRGWLPRGPPGLA